MLQILTGPSACDAVGEGDGYRPPRLGGRRGKLIRAEDTRVGHEQPEGAAR